MCVCVGYLRCVHTYWFQLFELDLDLNGVCCLEEIVTFLHVCSSQGMSGGGCMVKIHSSPVQEKQHGGWLRRTHSAWQPGLQLVRNYFYSRKVNENFEREGQWTALVADDGWDDTDEPDDDESLEDEYSQEDDEDIIQQ